MGELRGQKKRSVAEQKADYDFVGVLEGEGSRKNTGEKKDSLAYSTLARLVIADSKRMNIALV